MAVVMMAGDDKKPIFHDFLAISCENSPATIAAAAEEVITTSVMETEASASVLVSAGVSSVGQGFPSRNADQVSGLVGRQTVSNSDAFVIHGRKDDSSGPEASNTFSGRKRPNSDSQYMGFLTDKIRSECADAAECSHSLKMLGKEVASDRMGKFQEDEVQFPVQPPLRSTSLHSPLSSRPFLPASQLEWSIPMNPSSMVHYPSRIITQSGLFSSSHLSKDANANATLISQPAADEGSRTGIKGSGVLNVITSSGGLGDRSISRVIPFSGRSNSAQIKDPESSNALRYHEGQKVARQMTIFYAGQAHVFDDVHPNKAEVIMALAGSTGGSWSTTYSQKAALNPSVCDSKVPSEEIQRHIGSFPSSIHVNPENVLSQVDRTSLTRDIPSVTAAFGYLGSQQSGRVIGDGRLAIQATLPRSEGKRDAS